MTDKIAEQQFRDLTSHNLRRIKKVMKEHEEIGQRLQLKERTQHILGIEDYEDRLTRDLVKGKVEQSWFEKVSEFKIYN